MRHIGESLSPAGSFALARGESQTTYVASLLVERGRLFSIRVSSRCQSGRDVERCCASALRASTMHDVHRSLPEVLQKLARLGPTEVIITALGGPPPQENVTRALASVWDRIGSPRFQGGHSLLRTLPGLTPAPSVVRAVLPGGRFDLSWIVATRPDVRPGWFDILLNFLRRSFPQHEAEHSLLLFTTWPHSASSGLTESLVFTPSYEGARVHCVRDLLPRGVS